MTVLQMRLVVEAEDYDRALAFYRDVLGLLEELAVAGEDDARVTILAFTGARSHAGFPRRTEARRARRAPLGAAPASGPSIRRGNRARESLK